MIPKRAALTYASIIAAMICWSLSFIWYKQSFVHYRPVTVIVLRLVLAVPLLFFITFLTGRSLRIRREHLTSFALLGFFEPFLYFMGESHGVKLLSSTTASVIISTIPLFAPIAAWYLFRERLTWINYLGMVISFAGVFIILKAEGTLETYRFSGVLLMLVAVFSAIFYSVYVKKLMGLYSAFTIVAYQSLFGLCFFIPVFFVADLSHFLTVHHNLAALLPIIKLAVFASSFAFILFVFSIRNLGIARTNVFVNLIPALTAVFSFFLLKEAFGWLKIAGVGIVVTGLLFSQIQQRMIKNGQNGEIMPFAETTGPEI